MKRIAVAAAALSLGLSAAGGGHAMQNPALLDLQSISVACVGGKTAEELCKTIAAALEELRDVPVTIVQPEALPRNDAKQPASNHAWLNIQTKSSSPTTLFLEWGSSANRAGIGQNQGSATFDASGRDMSSREFVTALIAVTPFG